MAALFKPAVLNLLVFAYPQIKTYSQNVPPKFLLGKFLSSKMRNKTTTVQPLPTVCIPKVESILFLVLFYDFQKRNQLKI